MNETREIPAESNRGIVRGGGTLYARAVITLGGFRLLRC